MHIVSTGRRLAAVLTLTTVFGVLAGCASSGPAVTVTPQSTAIKGEPPAPKPGDPWPLTGKGGDVVTRPAVAVKIENSPESRPQTGLQAADIVWEEMVEGGIARFVAVYQSTLPDSIGPIRSIRPMDGPIAGPTKGLIAFSGGQAPFVEAARAAGLQTLSDDLGSGGFTRSPEHSAPHNLFGSLSEFIAQADDDHKASPPSQFDYATSAETATAAKNGKAVSVMRTSISQVSRPVWTWSAKAEAFLRAEGDEPAIDAASGKQLSATNVVALNVTTRAAGGTDAAGSSIPETVLVDSKGTGVVATGGNLIDVTWSKKAAGDVLELATADGTKVKLAPGNTWVELVPDGLGSIETN